MAHPPDKMLYVHTVLLINETDQVEAERDAERDWREREFSWCIRGAIHIATT
jgi:hypothetical protein